eukprot:TRINITY_DN12193_c0_g3_i1.p1 TRINITY_DN12193_c0_g3~~TRINITY_DN12193_c0_g3_i1.p1  ORF type:complete len:725 (+),score=143.80 TRINITY_DN12193_c0_g3_i1:43-2175(+)
MAAVPAHLKGYEILGADIVGGGMLYSLVHKKSRMKVVFGREEGEGTVGIGVRGEGGGVAHVTEHAVLCGSKKYRTGDAFFAAAGRTLTRHSSAVTTPLLSAFSVTTAEPKTWLGLLTSFLFSPLLSSPAVHREARIAANEMASLATTPSAAHATLVQRNLFKPASPYSRPPGGDAATLPFTTPEAVRAYHSKNYLNTGNCLMVCLGRPDLLLTLDRLLTSNASCLRFDGYTQPPDFDKSVMTGHRVATGRLPGLKGTSLTWVSPVGRTGHSTEVAGTILMNKLKQKRTTIEGLCNGVDMDFPKAVLTVTGLKEREGVWEEVKQAADEATDETIRMEMKALGDRFNRKKAWARCQDILSRWARGGDVLRGFEATMADVKRDLNAVKQQPLLTINITDKSPLASSTASPRSSGFLQKLPTGIPHDHSCLPLTPVPDAVSYATSRAASIASSTVTHPCPPLHTHLAAALFRIVSNNALSPHPSVGDDGVAGLKVPRHQDALYRHHAQHVFRLLEKKVGTTYEQAKRNALKVHREATPLHVVAGGKAGRVLSGVQRDIDDTHGWGQRVFLGGGQEEGSVECGAVVRKVGRLSDAERGRLLVVAKVLGGLMHSLLREQHGVYTTSSLLIGDALWCTTQADPSPAVSQQLITRLLASLPSYLSSLTTSSLAAVKVATLKDIAEMDLRSPVARGVIAAVAKADAQQLMAECEKIGTT